MKTNSVNNKLHPHLSSDANSLHLSSLQSGLTFTEMLDSAYDHLWLTLDSSNSKDLSVAPYSSDANLSSNSSSSTSSGSVRDSPEIEAGTPPAFLECHSGSFAQRGDFAVHGVGLDAVYQPHFAPTHSSERSCLPDGSSSQFCQVLSAQSQPYSALTLTQESLLPSNTQNEWHTVNRRTRPVASAFEPSALPVHVSPSYHPKPPNLHDRRSDIFLSRSTVGPKPELCINPRDQQTSHSSQLYSGVHDHKSDNLPESFAFPSASSHDRTGPPDFLGNVGNAERHRTLDQDGLHYMFRQKSPLPAHRAVGRYEPASLQPAPMQTLDAQQPLSQGLHTIYDRAQATHTWNFPGPSANIQQPKPRILKKWTFVEAQPPLGNHLPEIHDTASLMPYFGHPAQPERSRPESSLLAQRRTRQSRSTSMDTMLYCRKSLRVPGLPRVRKAAIFNPEQPIQCKLLVERGHRKGQKCNVWCDGIAAFTSHLKGDCHNYSSCKRPWSQSPGPDFVPNDDGLRMEWGFCTWNEDNDCETFRLRRFKNRLGPMSAGDLIRHIREAHAGVPRY